MTDPDDSRDARDETGTTDAGPATVDTSVDPKESDGSMTETEERRVRDHVTLARVLNVVGFVLLLAVVVPFAVYAFPQLVGASESYVVLSGSMEPAMSPGDAIVVEDVDATEIETGDVITFSRDAESRPTTHRVVDVQREDGEVSFQTKGDANEGPDEELVGEAALEGRVMTIEGHLFVIPYIGYVLDFASTQTGFLVLFVLPIGLFLLNEVHAFVTGVSSSEDDSEEIGTGGQGSDDSARGGPDFDRNSPASAETGETTDRGAPEREPGSAASTHGLSGSHDPASSGEPGSITPASEVPESTATDAVSVRPAELRIGVIVLAGFSTYSSWVAYTLVEPWAVGTAAAVVMATLLFGSLYAFGEPAGEDARGDATGARGTSDHEDSSVERTGSRVDRESAGVDAGVASGDDDAGVVVEIGEPDAAAFDRPRVSVPVYDAMVELAAVTGGVVYRDPEDPIHFVPGSEVTYVHRGRPAGDDDADGDSSRDVADRVEDALASPAVDGALRGVDDGSEGGASDASGDPAAGPRDPSDPRDAVESESSPPAECGVHVGFERRNARDSTDSNEGAASADRGDRDRGAEDPELASLDPAMEELERRARGESDD